MTGKNCSGLRRSLVIGPGKVFPRHCWKTVVKRKAFTVCLKTLRSGFSTEHIKTLFFCYDIQEHRIGTLLTGGLRNILKFNFLVLIIYFFCFCYILTSLHNKENCLSLKFTVKFMFICFNLKICWVM